MGKIKFIITIDRAEFDAYMAKSGYGISDTAISDLLEETFESVEVEEPQ